MQQTDSRNEFLTLENMEMDTNFIQIEQVFYEIMQFLFLPLGGSNLLPKTEKANCSGPNHSISSIFFKLMQNEKWHLLKALSKAWWLHSAI